MKETAVDAHAQSALVGYINNFQPSPIHSSENDPNSEFKLQ